MSRIIVPADAERVVPAAAVDATIAALRDVVAGRRTLTRVPDARDSRIRLLAVGEGRSLLVFVVDGGVEGVDTLVVGVEDAAEAETQAANLRLFVHEATGVPIVASEASRVSAAAPGRLFSRLGVTGETLAALGVAAELAEAALGCDDESQLLAVAGSASQRSQGETLRTLAVGASPAQVRSLLGFAPIEASEADTDRCLHDAFRGRASRMNYALVDADEPGDLEWLLRGVAVEDWRVFLHPAQRGLVELDTKGPARVTGGAGTGKTVVLLHRAAVLARRNPGARIVLTTFTRNLADKMSEDLHRLDPSLPRAKRLGEPGIYVAGIDAIARQVLDGDRATAVDVSRDVFGASMARGFRCADSRESQSRWVDSLDAVGAGVPGLQRSVEFFKEEYESIILPNGVTSAQTYIRIRRPGRGDSLTQAARMAVWGVVEDYRRSARAQGVIDFSETVALAAAALDRRVDNERPVDHLLVDEAQDLSSCHWRLVRRLTVPGLEDLFVAEDAHQRIYARRVSLKNEGVHFKRSGRLDLSYRTTEQNLWWAMAVLDGHTFHDLTDELESHSYRATRSGQDPISIGYETRSDELRGIADTVTEWVSDGAKAHECAVIVRTNTEVGVVGAELRDVGLLVNDSGGRPRPNHVTVMTMHRAKGTEFPRILIAGASRQDQRGTGARLAADVDRHDALLRERSLMYVAATRARDAFVVTWCKAPSEMVAPSDWADPERRGRRLGLTRDERSWGAGLGEVRRLHPRRNRALAASSK